MNAQTDFTAQHIRLMIDSSGGRFIICWLVSLQTVNAIAPSTGKVIKRWETCLRKRVSSVEPYSDHDNVNERKDK